MSMKLGYYPISSKTRSAVEHLGERVDVDSLYPECLADLILGTHLDSAS